MAGARHLRVLVGCCLIAAILLFALNSSTKFHTLSPDSASDHQTKEAAKTKMDLDHWLNGTFRYRTVYPQWISGSEYIIRNGSFDKVNIETGNSEELLPEEAWTQTTNPSSWLVSGDQKYIAIMYNNTDGYAHYVRTFSVDIWDVTTDEKVENVDIPKNRIQKFKWSPTGHYFSYVYGFDVFINTNFSNPSKRITSDGNEQLVFNGISDWLFSIEITDDDALLWWSPDSSYLAFAKLNQDDVIQFEFTVYNEQQYPETIHLPYPKPGKHIPKTNIWMVTLSNMTSEPLQPNVEAEWDNDGYYLNSAVWRKNVFTPTWKNRVENESITNNCIAPDFQCTHGKSMTDHSHTGWLGHYKVSHIYPLNTENEYVTVQSNNGYPHVVLINTTDDTLGWRTDGEFEATDTSYGYESIHFYDDTTDWIYFTSTENPNDLGRGLPRIRHVWRVKGHGDDKTRECVTCRYNTDYKDRCNWVTPSFSPNGSYVVVNCGGTGNGVPITLLLKRDASGNYAFENILEDNQELQDTINEFEFRTIEFDTIQLPGVQGEWHYMLLKPPNFNPNGNYPLLVEVYSGPGFQEVQDRFSVTWKDYIASSEGVVVMSFDGRGTGFRGDEIMHMVYKKLGQYEPLDQIEAARQMGEKSFIDKNKTAIWGWSYGGYATSRTIGEDADNVYRCGFAVAPVTMWELYHTIYTERYMLMPEDNEDGYEKSSALQNWENFNTHRYTVFHGTRDENVHFQNAARLSKYLIEHNVDFRAFFAADDDHQMRRVPNNYKNIYKMLTNQLRICFR